MFDMHFCNICQAGFFVISDECSSTEHGVSSKHLLVDPALTPIQLPTLYVVFRQQEEMADFLHTHVSRAIPGELSER